MEAVGRRRGAGRSQRWGVSNDSVSVKGPVAVAHLGEGRGCR